MKLRNAIVSGVLVASIALGAMGLKGVPTPQPAHAASTAISVTDYGATGNDTTDDTYAIQQALNAGAQSGSEVDIPAGNYYINPVTGLNINTNQVLHFDSGAKLIALPTSNGTYNMVKIWGVNNVTINGYPTIVGDRDTHTGTTGEWGMGLSIKSASNVDIENANVSNCWGDGVYLGEVGTQYGNYATYNKDVTLNNIVLNNNRRQGISVITAIHLNIINPIITNTNGTAPAAGIDFEPNSTAEYLQNINVINPNISGNAGNGIQFYFGNLGATNPVSINIDDTSKVINNATPNVEIYGNPNVSKGYIIVAGSYLWQNP